MRDRLARVLGVTLELQGLGAVEGDRVACLARTVRVCTLERGFFGGLGLGVFGGNWMG